MHRFIGLDAHSESCTLAVVGPSGKRLKSVVVETNGRALLDAIQAIPGHLHVCMEEGEQSAWLYEVLEPHVEELVVTVPRATRGVKERPSGRLDARRELRMGAVAKRIYKAPRHLAALRNAASGYRGDSARRRAREEPSEGSVPISWRSRRQHGLRLVRAERLAQAATHATASARGSVWSRAGRAGSVARRGRGATPEGGPLASDHPQAGDRTRHGTNQNGPAHGDRWHTSSLSDTPTVLELLWAGYRDALVGRLVARQGRIVVRATIQQTRGLTRSRQPLLKSVFKGAATLRAHSQARASLWRLHADARRRNQAEPRQAYRCASNRRRGALDVEARGGLQPGTPETRRRSRIGNAPRHDADAIRSESGASRPKGSRKSIHPPAWSPMREGRPRSQAMPPRSTD